MITSMAYLSAGCFWGVEYLIRKELNIIKTSVGYMGGTFIYPSYQQVSSGKTGHLESVRVEYSPSDLAYESVIKFFFEIHDFSQEDGQGPDLGEQYRSAIFYNNEQERLLSLYLITHLKSLNYHVATQLYPATHFYEAELYHQNYYNTTKSQPYCHFRKSINWPSCFKEAP